jgi:hypothetical protein
MRKALRLCAGRRVDCQRDVLCYPSQAELSGVPAFLTHTCWLDVSCSHTACAFPTLSLMQAELSGVHQELFLLDSLLRLRLSPEDQVGEPVSVSQSIGLSHHSAGVSHSLHPGGPVVLD